jgi:hypothetical protein
VEAASDTLEQIIRDELRQPVAELVRQVVLSSSAKQLNGAAETGVSDPENAEEPRLPPQALNPATARRKTARIQRRRFTRRWASS